jgi:ribosome-binding factor A
MGTRRQEQVAERIHQELSSLLLTESKDPRVANVNVTEVMVTSDLKLAKIYVTVLGEAEEGKQALEGLEHASNYLRREVSRRVQLRLAPEFMFLLDESWKRGARIDELLQQIHAAAPVASADEPANEGGA